jgi:diacylglycerol kinase family enzyme
VNGFFDGAGQRLAGADATAFGVVTSGTGGDFRRTFGWATEPLEDLKRLKRFETRKIDVGRVTFGDGLVRTFVNIASFGMSGEVVDVVNNSSKALGAKLSFMLGSVRTMVGHKPQRVRVTCEDGKGASSSFEDDMTLVAVANGQYFGGGMWVAPQAKVDDGVFDCVAVSGGGLGFWLKQGLKVYTGKHIGLREVRVDRVAKVKAEPVSPGERVLVEIDGEQPGILPATFEILPGALSLLV